MTPIEHNLMIVNILLLAHSCVDRVVRERGRGRVKCLHLMVTFVSRALVSSNELTLTIG